jgi:hypothetical protein
MSNLPIRRVTLFRHGVGYFERETQIEGEQSLSLSFKQREVSDVLKTRTEKGFQLTPLYFVFCLIFVPFVLLRPIPLLSSAVSSRASSIRQSIIATHLPPWLHSSNFPGSGPTEVRTGAAAPL